MVKKTHNMRVTPISEYSNAKHNNTVNKNVMKGLHKPKVCKLLIVINYKKNKTIFIQTVLYP